MQSQYINKICGKQYSNYYNSFLPCCCRHCSKFFVPKPSQRRISSASFKPLLTSTSAGMLSPEYLQGDFTKSLSGAKNFKTSRLPSTQFHADWMLGNQPVLMLKLPQGPHWQNKASRKGERFSFKALWIQCNNSKSTTPLSIQRGFWVAEPGKHMM